MPAAPNAAIEPSFAPLLPIRLAQPFEALREASDQILARTGARPKIFLATLGAPAEFTARASFARNFFEAGGIEAVSHDGDLAGLAARFQASGASLACLCASDQTYESEAAPAAATLKAAGTRHIYLAGRPGKSEASYRHAGVQDFVFAGCDALAVLEAAHGLMRNGRIAS
jgi:methylmalonyl-CoA mutase